MSKQKNINKMSVDEILKEVDSEFMRWKEISLNGCSDPFWPDGMNMNLIRNHIIYWYTILKDKLIKERQLSLFEEEAIISHDKSLPPKVPANYLIRNCKYSNRLEGRGMKLEYGFSGEYKIKGD